MSSLATREKQGPTAFKVTHPNQNLARRLRFAFPPSYSVLSSKLVSIWPDLDISITSSFALSYVDDEGDRVLLNSDEELKGLYAEWCKGKGTGGGEEEQCVRMRVVVAEEGEGEGAEQKGGKDDWEKLEEEKVEKVKARSSKTMGLSLPKPSDVSGAWSRGVIHPSLEPQLALPSNDGDSDDEMLNLLEHTAADMPFQVPTKKKIVQVAQLSETDDVVSSVLSNAITGVATAVGSPAPAPVPSALHSDLIDAFTQFIATPAFSTILDRLAQGAYLVKEEQTEEEEGILAVAERLRSERLFARAQSSSDELKKFFKAPPEIPRAFERGIGEDIRRAKEEKSSEVASAHAAEGGNVAPVATSSPSPVVEADFEPRELTEQEKVRAQGFPPGYDIPSRHLTANGMASLNTASAPTSLFEQMRLIRRMETSLKPQVCKTVRETPKFGAPSVIASPFGIRGGRGGGRRGARFAGGGFARFYGGMPGQEHVPFHRQTSGTLALQYLHNVTDPLSRARLLQFASPPHLLVDNPEEDVLLARLAALNLLPPQEANQPQASGGFLPAHKETDVDGSDSDSNGLTSLIEARNASERKSPPARSTRQPTRRPIKLSRPLSTPAPKNKNADADSDSDGPLPLLVESATGKSVARYRNAGKKQADDGLESDSSMPELLPLINRGGAQKMGAALGKQTTLDTNKNDSDSSMPSLVSSNESKSKSSALKSTEQTRKGASDDSEADSPPQLVSVAPKPRPNAFSSGHAQANGFRDRIPLPPSPAPTFTTDGASRVNGNRDTPPGPSPLFADFPSSATSFSFGENVSTRPPSAFGALPPATASFSFGSTALRAGSTFAAPLSTGVFAPSAFDANLPISGPGLFSYGHDSRTHQRDEEEQTTLFRTAFGDARGGAGRDGFASQEEAKYERVGRKLKEMGFEEDRFGEGLREAIAACVWHDKTQEEIIVDVVRELVTGER